MKWMLFSSLDLTQPNQIHKRFLDKSQKPNEREWPGTRVEPGMLLLESCYIIGAAALLRNLTNMVLSVSGVVT